jgi:hypothetical protein
MGNNKSIISTDLEKQCETYKENIKYIIVHELFKRNDERLERLVDTYIQFYHDRVEGTDALDDILIIDPKIISVWCVHKLYPMKYREGYIDKDWLIRVCLHHYDFCMKILPVLQYNFKYIKWKEEYITLLTEIKVKKRIIVPTLKQVFVLYSHMQDHDGYIKDIVNQLGYVLSP